ncbi:MAG: hypothetical protein COZ06_27590 [Armatimonadetes bacterium CG_4_10_14_3_um_filter_66_18]|nr:TIM barrel protein [Armatimonadota bacterium]NCQ29411.1 TIM barrel protein [Armatimonadota bacterium]PIU90790.1 MAG: hypothetical protein COS65_24110 [Armatimonadetes bacterium CG06_land_8_20_14_3_00_66_21]PIX46111.1 MAG: hypothetical protein COZ57_13475 [Armatimonadetes bacterium CG_4_8_14_3_um_filter_66_20]PIY40851.1 MAG: hypothetical protein COZ06_27590 [Armatimonadetes bacterium CG_4_10_14_3_um_filter_66_18]
MSAGIYTAGADVTLLHEFAGGASDGSGPRGDLTLSDSTLYGMTGQGGVATPGEWRHVIAQVFAAKVQLIVDGKLALEYVDPKPVTNADMPGLIAWSEGEFDNVRIYAGGVSGRKDVPTKEPPNEHRTERRDPVPVRGVPMIRFGGPLFGDQSTPEKLITAARELGYGAVYAPRLDPENEALCQEYGEALLGANLMVAEVGVWTGLNVPDPEKRGAARAGVVRGLRLAELIGAQCVVAIFGAQHPQRHSGPHPDNFEPRFVEEGVRIVQGILDEVQPRHTKLTMEMLPWAVPDSVENTLELIAAVDRPAFGVHLDPVNLINCPRRYYDTGAVLRECFEKLGPHIVACHAKDVVQDESVFPIHLNETPIGTGRMDYATFLRGLDARGRDVPLMLEHLKTAEEYAAAAAQVRRVAAEIGVGLGYAA